MTKNIIPFLRARTIREYGLFFLVVCAAVLATVFISQSYGFHPCKLCIWQRWPYAVGVVFALALVIFSGNKKISVLLLSCLTLTFLVGAGIALFHLGVEYKWWEFHSDCTGDAFKTGSSAEDFLARLKAAPVVRCDQRFPFLFGMTMAFYNILTSIGLAVLAFFASYSLRSNSLSQYK